MSGMGKGNATSYASLYDGRGLSIRKPSVLSTASAAAFGMSFGTPVEQGNYLTLRLCPEESPFELRVPPLQE
jgi:hypothetical protein